MASLLEMCLEDRVQARMDAIRFAKLEDAIENEARRRLNAEKRAAKNAAKKAAKKVAKENENIKLEEDRIDSIKSVFYAYWASAPEYICRYDEARQRMSALGVTRENITKYLPAHLNYYMDIIFFRTRPFDLVAFMSEGRLRHFGRLPKWDP
jgi:hypothetical protein